MTPRRAVAWLAAGALTAGGLSAAEHARSLTLLNWSEYIEPELVAEFESRFDAQVQEIYYESDDLLDAMLLESDASGYDLVMVSGIRLDGYRKRGWLAPIDERRVPNLRHVDSRWRDAFPGTREYGVPYFWGTVGIAYRSDLVAPAPVSWMDLLRPDPALAGRIGMIESMRDSIGMALKALGHSVNTSNGAAIDQAAELLKSQRPFVSTYRYPNLDRRSAMVTGELWIAMMYNGDAIMLKQFEPRIEFVMPIEGGSIWVDYWAVLSTSRHKELAWQFVNFINEPENAARIAQYVRYASPNSAAAALLPAEFLADEAIYPPSARLADYEFYGEVASRATKKAQTAFARILR